MRHMLTTRLDPAKLRRAMERAGLKPAELAHKAGLSSGTVRAYLSGARGKRPSFSVILALANALGLRPEDLLGDFLPAETTNVGTTRGEEPDALVSN
ncbi:helix-turn-helix domain-containing protein [Thermus hydrothermalis]|uniref:helix-turn-helix domain-containing protein n=1 Tax=Thermus hydrothermalis TaxID=2908148 RepID=UPI003C12C14E